MAGKERSAQMFVSRDQKRKHVHCLKGGGGICSSYNAGSHPTMLFQGVMVRLMLVLAPVMCILSAIAVSSTLSTHMKNLDISRQDKKAKKGDINYPFKNEVSVS